MTSSTKEEVITFARKHKHEVVQHKLYTTPNILLGYCVNDIRKEYYIILGYMNHKYELADEFNVGSFGLFAIDINGRYITGIPKDIVFINKEEIEALIKALEL